MLPSGEGVGFSGCVRGDELGGSSRVGDLPEFGEVFGSRETPGFAGVQAEER